ncbi:hypothetical protein [Streptomyces sp. 7N604]|uniref:hypothetical protein n=1 Tax=Streptomyces sp. 7N604 TaxID=3457415 RepID=UPI003FCF946E
MPADRYRIDVLPWPDRSEDIEGRPLLRENLHVPEGSRPLVPGDPVDFHGFSSLHCVLVGHRTQILDEASQLVAAHEHAEAVDFQSLLRSRGVHGPARPYRSLVLSAQEDPEEMTPHVARRRPAVCVLDGAAAVSRWLAGSMASVAIALVERTAPSADAATDALYEQRSRSEADLALPEDLAGVPVGIEVLAWRHQGGHI